MRAPNFLVSSKRLRPFALPFGARKRLLNKLGAYARNPPKAVDSRATDRMVETFDQTKKHVWWGAGLALAAA